MITYFMQSTFLKVNIYNLQRYEYQIKVFYMHTYKKAPHLHNQNQLRQIGVLKIFILFMKRRVKAGLVLALHIYLGWHGHSKKIYKILLLMIHIICIGRHSCEFCNLPPGCTVSLLFKYVLVFIMSSLYHNLFWR